MKSLGRVEGELFHRHFGEDTFKEILTKGFLEEVVVITYVGIKSAASNIQYIIDRFDGKTNKLTIVLGISWFRFKNTSTDKFELPKNINNDYEVLMKKLKELGDSENNNYSFKELTIYINSRCHIKAVYADNETYYGSQNFSKTSRSFTDNKTYPEVYNYHELVIRVQDKNGNQVKNLLKEIVNDKQHNELALSSGKFVCNVTFQNLDNRKSIKAINKELVRFKNLKLDFDKINESIKDYKLPKFEVLQLDKQDEESLISLFEKVVNSESYENAVEYLKAILETFTGEDHFISPIDNDEKLVDLKDRLEVALSLINDLKVQESSDLFSHISSPIQDAIKSFDVSLPLYISNVPLFEECYDPIIKVITDADADSLTGFNESYRDQINNEVLANPGDVSFEYVDNDGNPNENLVFESFPDSAVGEVHARLSDEIGTDVVELLYEPIKEHFSTWHSDLSDNLSHIKDFFEHIERSFEEDTYSRME